MRSPPAWCPAGPPDSPAEGNDVRELARHTLSAWLFSTEMVDLLIVNGWVIDGSGSDGFKAAVGIDGDTVRIFRGDVAGVSAARSIDASGCVVSPGFIDMHAHSGLMMLANPGHEPKVRQGVT